MVKKRVELVDEPLGPENASQRADIEQSFINVNDLSAASAIPENVADVRVLVGRKGSGKTHLLKHIELRSQSAGRHVYYEALNEDFFGNASLIKFRGQLSNVESVNLWINCWRFATISAAFSHFVCKRSSERASQAVLKTETTKDEIKSFFSSYVFEYNSTIGPFAALKRLFAKYQSLASLKILFAGLDFNEAEAELGRLLHHYGDIHYLIDGIDEFASTDPRLWLEPQLGLFKLSFLQLITRSGPKRVYVTVAIRTYVFSHALKDTSADRVQIGAGVVPLKWNAHAATTFMNRRLKQICRVNFAHSGSLTGDRPLAKWLGFSEFTPHSRGRPESVEDYLIRHTRCSPRHVIQMFTRLCKAQNRRFMEGARLDEQEFETIIKEQSRAIADSALQTASEELLSYVRLERDVNDRKLVDAARGWYNEETVEAIRKAIRACGHEVVSRSDFQERLRASFAEMVTNDDAGELLSIAEDTLWRSGVIGYRVNEGSLAVWRYAWSDYEFGVGALPIFANTIGFHPSFVTSCSLEVSIDGPVF